MDAEGMEIRIEQGNGYMRESCQTYLRMDVFIAMMERADYTVTRNSA